MDNMILSLIILLTLSTKYNVSPSPRQHLKGYEKNFTAVVRAANIKDIRFTNT